jgi:hypothetical protein
MRRLFGGPGQRNATIDVEHFSLQMRRPPGYSIQYPPQRTYDSASFSKKRASRYDRMSILRNRCLQRVLKSSNLGFLIMMDADIDLNHDFLAVDGIAHSFEIRLLGNEWRRNVVCANSVSAASSPGVLLQRNLSETPNSAAEQWSFWDSLAYRDSSYTRNSWRKHPRHVHSPYDEPLRVESCFSGLSIYDFSRRENFMSYSYSSHVDNDCEHVHFSQCLQEHGWRILFNPRMIVAYRRAHQHFHL